MGHLHSLGRDSQHVRNLAPSHRGKTQTESTRQNRWEASTAGYLHEFKHFDTQGLTMPGSPRLEGKLHELIAEMAEVYELALLRDVPFSAFSEVSTSSNPELAIAISTLKELTFYISGGNLDRHRPKHLSKGNVFRGQTPGERVGPYLSQFLLVDNDLVGGCLTGKVEYDGGRIGHRVRIATPKLDYKTHWNAWLDVEYGASVEITMEDGEAAENAGMPCRFITTPRDLASYVQCDASYKTYHNTAVWLLNIGAPLDSSFASSLSGAASIEGDDFCRKTHVLTLVAELVAQALKAIRYQKYNNRFRAQPQDLAARIAASEAGILKSDVEKSVKPIRLVLDEIGLLHRIREHNKVQNKRHSEYLDSCKEIAAIENLPLLPMAYIEGSPTHYAHGAGDGIVAGACVTLLKALFDEEAFLVRDREGAHSAVSPKEYRNNAAIRGWEPFSYIASLNNGDRLEPSGDHTALTVGGELNKLAANISIGRNMGGFHYYSDYIEGIRIGEAIASRVLKEQALTYECSDSYVFQFRSFDDNFCTF